VSEFARKSRWQTFTPVELPRTYREEIKAWLVERSVVHYIAWGSYSTFTYMVERHADALLLKLTWGGDV
jgi:hypothetical protein